MKFQKTITVEAKEFVQDAFTAAQGKPMKGGEKQKYFDSIEVRHNGQEHFIHLPTPDGEKKVLEDQVIVTHESGKVEILSKEAFEAEYSPVEAEKPKKGKAKDAE